MNGIFLCLLSLATFLHSPSGTDVGLIGYFPNDCPENWVEYPSLEGKFILSDGNYIGLAEDGRTEIASYAVGDLGGEVLHTQTINELAPHSHNMRVNTDNGNAGSTTPYSSQGIYSFMNTDDIVVAGSGHPANNMPPYLVLKACQKAIDDSSIDITAVKTEIHDALITSFNGSLPQSLVSNSAPVIENHIPSVSFYAGDILDYPIDGTFFHPSGDKITLEATLANGSALPSFIQFFGSAKRFLGNPTMGNLGIYSLKVTALDSNKENITDAFLLLIKDPSTNATTIVVSGSSSDDKKASNRDALLFGMAGSGIVLTLVGLGCLAYRLFPTQFPKDGCCNCIKKRNNNNDSDDSDDE